MNKDYYQYWLQVRNKQDKDLEKMKKLARAMDARWNKILYPKQKIDIRFKNQYKS